MSLSRFQIPGGFRAYLQRRQILLRFTQLWILALIAGSLQPARPGPVVNMHRWIHFAAFAGTAFLLFLLARTPVQEIQAAIGTCLLGLTLEFSQHLLYRNDLEWHDVRDDTLAVAGAFVLYRIARVVQAVYLPAPGGSS